MARAKAAAEVAEIRFNSVGYVWINDNTLPYPTMISHPMKPQLNGKVLDDKKFNCTWEDKRNLFQVMAEVCNIDRDGNGEIDGEGYVAYHWPKPPKPGVTTEVLVPKVSYVRLFKPWNWIIGVGVYIDKAIEDAKNQSKAELKKLRFDDGTGYFWITDDTSPIPTMLMHATAPQLDGKILDDSKYNCAFGPQKTNLFKAMVDVCNIGRDGNGEIDGEGFVDYVWPKPDSVALVEKLSYVKHFKQWNWIIGTGIYVDDVVKSAKEKTIEEIRKLKYDNGNGYFWIQTNESPIPTMVMHKTNPDLEDKPLDDPKYNCEKDTNNNFFKSMVDRCAESGEGFVEYNWPKMGSDKPEPKFSYVKEFKEWGWIIGTGVYVDHINKRIAAKELEIQEHVSNMITMIVLGSMAVLFLGLMVCSVASRKLAHPIHELIGKMKDVRLDNLDSVNIQLSGVKEIIELGDIFNNMAGDLNEAVTNLEKTTADKEKIEAELNIAKDIQLSIIPKFFPAFPERKEFDVHATLQTAKAVGGDLYDFFFVDDHKLCFAIGDVAGKGVPAALFMAVTRTLLRAKAKRDRSVADIVKQMNLILCPENEVSMFVTFFIGILDTQTGEVEYCNAGHTQSVIIHDDKSLETIETVHGLPLGIFEDQEYKWDSLQLKPGESIVTYTDGVTESLGSKDTFFGDDAMLETIADKAGETPQVVTEHLLAKVNAFAEGVEQADDIAILVLKYKGSNK